MSESPLHDEPLPSNMPPGRNSFPGETGFQMDGNLRRMIAGDVRVEVVESKVEKTLDGTQLTKVGLISPRDMSDAEYAGLPMEIRMQFPRDNPSAVPTLAMPGEDPLVAQMRALQAQLDAKREAKARALQLATSAPADWYTEIKRLASEIIIETATAETDKVRDNCRNLAVAILTQCK